MNRLLLLFVILLSWPMPSLRGALLPEYRIDAMCFAADLVLEGEWIGNSKIYVHKVYKGEELLQASQTTVNVYQLQLHNREFDQYSSGKAKGAELEATRLIAFLERSGEDWRSLITSDFRGECGSFGIIWYDEKGTYGYRQAMTTIDPLTLFPGSEIYRIPNSIEELRQEIHSGMKVANEIDRALAIKDPKSKAVALSRYLLESTFPDGFNRSIPFRVRYELASLGAEAVPAVIDAIKVAKVNERVDLPILVLYDIGPKAQPAISVLLEFLNREEQAYTQYILGALGEIGDPAAISYIEPFLEHENSEVAEKAQRALEKINGESLE